MKNKPVRTPEPKEDSATVKTINSPAAMTRQASEVAGLCKEIVLKSVSIIKEKQYVRVEGWQAIASAHGCVAGARDVEAIEGGVRCVGELRKIQDGTLIAQAEGFVGDDEQNWQKRAVYARRAMAQTRAISRVCRSAFAHIVVLIDEKLSTTPAEEMQFDHDEPMIPKEEKHRPTRRYEEETGEGDKKVTGDLVELKAFLTEHKIPDGFLLALLTEKKLIDGHTKTVAGLKPGILRRVLAPKSLENLVTAYRLQIEADAADAESGSATAPKRTKKTDEEVRTREGDQTRADVRQPVDEGSDPIDLLEQEGIDNWRHVVIHFGKKKGEVLGKMSRTNLSWWVKSWTPKPFHGTWDEKDLILDAALVLASRELAGGDNE